MLTIRHFARFWPRKATFVALAMCSATCLAPNQLEVQETGGNRESPSDLLDLSLEELLEVRVSNPAVQRLRLDLKPEVANPHQRPIFESPLSIEILDSQTIEARGLKEVTEAVAEMTGVLSGESPGEPYSFSMRGFDRGSVAVLYDGISIGSSILDMRPLTTHNLERIEIAKGPVQLQHSHGAAAGTVNLVTKKPKFAKQPSGNASVSYGSFDTSSLHFGYNNPVADNAAFRIDFSRNESSGWVENSDSNSLSLLASGLWEASRDLQVLLSIEYLEDDLPAYWGTPLVTSDAAREPYFDILERDDGRIVDLSTRYYNYNVADRVIKSSSLWTKLKANWQIGPSTESQFTLYHFSADRTWRNAELYNFDPESGLVERDRLLVDHDRELSGFQWRLSHEGEIAGRENTFSLNLDYSRTRFYRMVGFDTTSETPYTDRVDLHNPDPGVFGSVNARPDSYDQDNLAVVFNDELELTDALTLDLVLRAERFDIDNRRFDFSGNPRPQFSLSDHFDLSSYRLGLSYQASNDVMVYAHHSVAHDPLRDDLAFFFELENFSPSEVKQSELGLKALYNDDKSELTFALFKIEKRNGAQTQPQSPTILNTRKSEGFEIASRSSITDTLTMGGNLSYAYARNGRYLDPIFQIDTTNKVPTNVPSVMASLWSSLSNLGGLPLEAGIGVNHVSSRYADPSNTSKLKEYTTARLFATYSLEDYKISLHIRNLTDEVYAPWSDVNYPNQIGIEAPRSYEINVQYSF